MDIHQKIVEAFKVEYADHLAHIRAVLGDLDASGRHPEEAELFEMYRRAHSLKGAARAAGLKPVEALGHEIESLFSAVKGAELSLDREARAVVERSLDAIEDWVCSLEFDPAPKMPDAVVRTVQEFLAKARAWSDSPTADPAGSDGGVRTDVRSSSTGRDAGIAVDVAHETKEDTPPDVRFELPARAPSPSGYVRVEVSSLNRLLRTAGELVTHSLNQTALSSCIGEIEEDFRSVGALMHKIAGQVGDERLANADVIRAGKLADQFEVASRDVANIGARFRQMRQDYGAQAFVLRQLAETLRSDIAQTRMATLETVYGGFPKMIRDLAREEGREITFRLLGQKLKADRAVIDILKDPVLHLLRNAVFHGIETADERRAAGKDPNGQISLRFQVIGNRLIVVIEDDGRGLDLERIREKLVEERVISTDDARDIGRSELVEHLMRPGFSTTRRVTSIAGRGLGLSIVREALRDLNGRVDVKSEPGKGCQFILDAPLSIATQSLLLVEVDDALYGIPTNGIGRLLQFKANTWTDIEGRLSIVYGGEQVPLVALGSLIHIGVATVDLQGDSINIAVLDDGRNRVAVAVDRFRALNYSMVLSIGLRLDAESCVNGGILLEDGSVACVLDPDMLIREATRDGVSHSLSAAASEAPQGPPTLLVVDDSFTTRTLEKSVLEANGYVVHLAVDGIEAMERLHADKYDLVVTDIEMPRLDGWGLLQRIKSDRSLSGIPVVVVTSRENEADRQRGMVLGADAYIVKQRFDQRDLLETIYQLL